MDFRFEVVERKLPSLGYNLRKSVFVDEQHFSLENEFDCIDEIAIHILLYYKDIFSGYVRVYRETDKNVYHIGRLCIVKDKRGKGYGKMLMKKAEEEISLRGGKYISLSAQCTAKLFYKSLSYEEEGEVYKDEWCPHIKMVKTLSA